MYLLISNTGTVDRNYLQLLGASDKSGSDKIGQFGSGAKLGAIALMRLGYEVSITSSDSEGEYRLEFAREATSIGKDRVVFLINGLRYPSSYTVDAGLNWDRPVGEDTNRTFKGIREFIANAMDADGGWHLSKGNAVLCQAGETIVGISISPLLSNEIESFLSNRSKYIKFAGDASEFEGGKGGIYPKSDTSHTRLFIKGFLAGCTDEKSTYDYSLNDNNLLSEERTISYYWKYREGIMEMVGMLRDKEKAVAVNFLKACRENTFERNAADLTKGGHLCNTKEGELFWVGAFHGAFGRKSCLSSLPQTDTDMTGRGYGVINFPEALAYALSECGVKYSFELAGASKEGQKGIQAKAEWETKIATAREIMRWSMPEVRDYKTGYFQDIGETQDIIGYMNSEEKVIHVSGEWLDKQEMPANLVDIIALQVHEMGHDISGAADCTREFRKQADYLIAKLMIQNYQLWQEIGKGIKKC